MKKNAPIFVTSLAEEIASNLVFAGVIANDDHFYSNMSRLLLGKVKEDEGNLYEMQNAIYSLNYNYFDSNVPELGYEGRESQIKAVLERLIDNSALLEEQKKRLKGVLDIRLKDIVEERLKEATIRIFIEQARNKTSYLNNNTTSARGVDRMPLKSIFERMSSRDYVIGLEDKQYFGNKTGYDKENFIIEIFEDVIKEYDKISPDIKDKLMRPLKELKNNAVVRVHDLRGKKAAELIKKYLGAYNLTYEDLNYIFVSDNCDDILLGDLKKK